MLILKDFKKYLQLKSLSKNSIKNYVSRIRTLLKKYTEINQENIDDFFLNSNYKENTINKYITALYHFIEFKDLKLKLPKVKEVPKRIKHTITKEYLFNTIFPMVDFVFKDALKIKTILIFLFYTGLRVEELCSLKRQQINIKNRYVKVYGSKSYEERLIPYFKKKVNTYLELYFSSESERKNAFNITKSTLEEKFRKLRPYLKELEEFTPHIMRHSYATHMLKKGMDSLILKQIMGHKNLETTEQYINLNFEDIQKRMDELDL